MSDVIQNKKLEKRKNASKRGHNREKQFSKLAKENDWSMMSSKHDLEDGIFCVFCDFDLSSCIDLQEYVGENISCRKCCGEIYNLIQGEETEQFELLEMDESIFIKLKNKKLIKIS